VIRHETLQRLSRFVGREGRDALLSALESEAERAVMTRYRAWLEESTVRTEAGTLGSGDGSVREAKLGTAAGHLRAFSRILRQLQTAFPEEWAALNNALIGRHNADRARLAFARIVAPLVDYYDSGGIERHSSEFDREELRAFVRYGVKRELMMLSRQLDYERVRAVTRPPRRHLVAPTPVWLSALYDEASGTRSYWVQEPSRGPNPLGPLISDASQKVRKMLPHGARYGDPDAVLADDEVEPERHDEAISAQIARSRRGSPPR
jgi:hypothetical protein